MNLTREQADIIAPGAWIAALLAIGFYAREHFIPGAVLGTLALGIYYAARDASHHD